MEEIPDIIEVRALEKYFIYLKFKKGEEKGYFKFGASTIVLLVKDIKIDEDLIKNTNNNLETIVKMG